VVKDFNFLGLKQKIQPQMFHQFSGHAPFHFLVRLKPGSPSKALEAIETVWKKVAPGYPLKYNFLDEDLNRFYQSEKRLSNIIAWAGGISIFLACLGLLGLAALAAINRTKEIGIRKVLGASIFTVWKMLSRDFVWLVIASFLLAAPLTYYFSNQWLQQYDYRTTISWWVFAVTGIGALVITLLTVSYQSIAAGMANPVDSLRSE